MGELLVLHTYEKGDPKVAQKLYTDVLWKIRLPLRLHHLL